MRLNRSSYTRSQTKKFCINGAGRPVARPNPEFRSPRRHQVLHDESCAEHGSNGFGARDARKAPNQARWAALEQFRGIDHTNGYLTNRPARIRKRRYLNGVSRHGNRYY